MAGCAGLFGGTAPLPVPIFFENRALLEAFRAGERHALEAVYRFYFDDVLRLASYGFITQNGTRASSVAREADRLDFVQDVFVKAFTPSARLGYDALRAYRPFILQIGRNLRVDQLRQSGRQPKCVAGMLDEIVDIDALIAQNSAWPETRGPDGDLHWQAQLREMSVALRTLDLAVQEIARLRFVDELSQADVAVRLGITRRRVRTLEDRLLSGVRRHFLRAGLGREQK